MARAESKVKIEYLPIKSKHHPAIISLIQPATPASRIIDPFAGKGEFLEFAAEQWNVTPYANELDKTRFKACFERFGAKQAVHGDAESVSR